MSNVLPVKEQKRVWAVYRMRFIFVGTIATSVLALIMLLTLVPSYILLVRNSPNDSSVTRTEKNKTDERAEAGKTQVLIAQLFPMVTATTSAMDAIKEVLSGRPDGIVVNRISYSDDAHQRTINIGGAASSREGVNALKKVLEGKGIYKSVSIPVSDLVGASGNTFTVTLISAH